MPAKPGAVQARPCRGARVVAAERETLATVESRLSVGVHAPEGQRHLPGDGCGHSAEERVRRRDLRERTSTHQHRSAVKARRDGGRGRILRSVQTRSLERRRRDVGPHPHTVERRVEVPTSQTALRHAGVLGGTG